VEEDLEEQKFSLVKNFVVQLNQEPQMVNGTLSNAKSQHLERKLDLLLPKIPTFQFQELKYILESKEKKKMMMGKPLHLRSKRLERVIAEIGCTCQREVTHHSFHHQILCLIRIKSKNVQTGALLLLRKTKSTALMHSM
jgi:hypothetical protein